MISDQEIISILEFRMKEIREQRRHLDDKYTELYQQWYQVWVKINPEGAT